MISAKSRYNRNYQSDMKEHDEHVAGIEVFWENHVVSRNLTEHGSSLKTLWTTPVTDT